MADPREHERSETLYHSGTFKVFLLRSQSPGTRLWDQFNLRAENSFTPAQIVALRRQSLPAESFTALELTRDTQNLVVRDTNSGRMSNFPLALLNKEVRDEIGVTGAAAGLATGDAGLFAKYLPGVEYLDAPAKAAFRKREP